MSYHSRYISVPNVMKVWNAASDFRIFTFWVDNIIASSLCGMNIMRSISTVYQYGTPLLTFSSNLLDYVIVLTVYLACVTCFRILMYVCVPWVLGHPSQGHLLFFLLQKSALLFLWLVRRLRSRRGRLWNGWGLQRCKIGILISFILVLNPWPVSQRNDPIILKRPAFHSGLRPSGLISWKLPRSLGTFSVLR